ncbi:MAG: hypothetical protein R3C56_01910 [Pirellulaceae bacterium]
MVHRLKLWEDSDLSDVLLQAEWLASSGQLEEALKQVDKKIADDPNEVPRQRSRPGCSTNTLAVTVREAFEFTRKLACVADLDMPLLGSAAARGDRATCLATRMPKRCGAQGSTLDCRL